MVLKTDTDGSQSLYLPQTKNTYINRLLQSINNTETLSTNKGELHLSSIASSTLQNIATDGNDTLNGTDANDKIVAKGGEGDDSCIFNKGDGVDVIEEKILNNIITCNPYGIYLRYNNTFENKMKYLNNFNGNEKGVA